MISFRYHIVSIVAVFLAIAVGVVVGTTALNGAVVGDLRRQVSDLKSGNADTTAQNKTLQAQAGNADLLAQTFGSKITGGTLTGKSVVLVGAPGATKAMKEAVAVGIVNAGGTVTGRVQLTAQFDDPKRANDVRTLTTTGVHPIGLQLPTSDDAGTLAGSLLGYVLAGRGQATDLTQVLAGFNTLGMMSAETPTVTKAKAIVLIAPGTLPKADAGGAMLLTFSTALGSSLGGPTVVAGDAASDTQGGLVALIRGDDTAQKAVSTVDDATGALGRVTVALTTADALAGRKGHYGTGSGADALLPGVSN